jgi:DNA-binding response OmpR family regulator
MDARSRFDKYNVLVIDDLASMRSQIVSTLNQLSFRNVWSVNSCQQALTHIHGIKFDLILCDYHLGDVTSGQQFLEHIRSHDLIPTSTLFIMITARRAYEDVMRVAECAPDEYLVKPFTGAQLDARISRQFERRQRLDVVHNALANQDWQLAIKHCDQIISARDQYAVDAMKLKGMALHGAQDYIAAETLYRGVLATRSLGWARFGLGKVLKATQRLTAAEIEFTTLIAEGAKNAASDRMGAYDELIDMLQNNHRETEALSIAEDAMTVSPGTLARARVITRLAVSEGDLALAEQTVRKLVEENKYSQVKEACDYLMAADVLVATGHPDDALDTINNVRKSFDEPSDLQTLAIAEVTVQLAKGNINIAEKIIQSIPIDDASNLPPAAAAMLGKSLYQLGEQDDADKIMRHLIQNNPDNQNIVRAVQSAMSSAGMQEEGELLVEASINEVAEINNEGVTLAYAGRLDEAIELLTRAADMRPGNLQFVSNAAVVIALSLTQDGMDNQRLSTCMRYRDALIARDPNHPKLVQINSLMQELHGRQNDVTSRRA